MINTHQRGCQMHRIAPEGLFFCDCFVRQRTDIFFTRSYRPLPQ